MKFDDQFLNSTDKMKDVVEDLKRLHGPTITSNLIRVNLAFAMSRPLLTSILFVNGNSVIETTCTDFYLFECWMSP